MWEGPINLTKRIWIWCPTQICDRWNLVVLIDRGWIWKHFTLCKTKSSLGDLHYYFFLLIKNYNILAVNHYFDQWYCKLLMLTIIQNRHFQTMKFMIYYIKNDWASHCVYTFFSQTLNKGHRLFNVVDRGGPAQKCQFFKWSKNCFWVIKLTVLSVNMISWKFGSLKLTITCPSKVSSVKADIFLSVVFTQYSGSEWEWTHIPLVPQ